MKFLVRLFLFCVVFGSMWAHGLVVSAQEHHQMGERSCLEHCLDSIQAQTAGSGVVLAPVVIFTTSVTDEILLTDELKVVECIDSYHDPGMILTTIKRE